MKKFFSFKCVLVLGLIMCSAVSMAVVPELPLDGFNLFVVENGGGSINYDQDAKTINYSYDDAEDNGWGYIGWTWEETGGVDLSAYSSIQISFDSQIETEGSLEFTVKYMEDAEPIKMSGNNQSTTFFQHILSPSKKHAIEYIYFKSQHSGQIILNNVSAALDGSLELSFSDPRFLDEWNDGNVWNPEENVVYFTELGSNSHFGWSYRSDDKIEFDEYDYLEVDFEILSGCETGIYVETRYSNEDGSDAGEAARNTSVKSTTGKAYVALNKNFPYFRNVFIHADEEGDVKLNSVTLLSGEMPEVEVPGKADIAIIDITWEPRNPQPGDLVTFTAHVENQGEVPTLKEKLGITFWVNGTFIAWHDVFGADNRILQPGESVDLTASGGPTSLGALWEYGSLGTYTVEARLDSQFANDASTENDIFSTEIYDLGAGVNNLNVGGKVYVLNNKLFIEGYPSSAAVGVYDLVGQSIDNNSKILAGVYIVTVKVDKKSYTHKVLVR